MPKGHAYPGPPEALDQFIAVVEGAVGDVDVKGAKSPYTSRNGHMFSFLDAEGAMALRLSDDDGEEFLATYDSGPVVSYGATMKGYVAVPADLFADTAAMAGWFERAFAWIDTLPPKATKKAKKR